MKNIGKSTRTRLIALLLCAAIAVAALPGAFTTEEAVGSRGDVNGDAVIDAADRTYLARYLAGWEGYTLG